MAGRFVRLFSAALLLAAALGGCSLMGLDDLSSGNAIPTEPSEAGSPKPDASPADGTSADAQPSAFCANLSPKPTVCLDFDGEPPFGAWVPKTNMGGQVEPSSSVFRSSPRSGRFSRSAGNDAAMMALGLELGGPSAPSEVVLAADVYVDARDTSQEMDIMLVSLPFGADTYEVQLSTADGAFQIEEWRFPSSGNDPSHNFDVLPQALPLATWLHVQLTVHLGAPSVASLVVDRVAVSSFPLTPPAGLGSPSVEIGDTYLLGGPYGFYIDDFTADVK